MSQTCPLMEARLPYQRIINTTEIDEYEEFSSTKALIKHFNLFCYLGKRLSGYVLYPTGLHLLLMTRTQMKVNHDSHRKASIQVRPWSLKRKR
jgi:hypothetical protein